MNCDMYTSCVICTLRYVYLYIALLYDFIFVAKIS